MIRDCRIREFLLHSIDESFLESLSGIPDVSIRYLVDTLEAFLVIMMCLELRSEYLRMNSLPFLGSPSRIVNPISHIADMQFLRQISRIHVRENFLAHLSVKHGHAIHIL